MKPRRWLVPTLMLLAGGVLAYLQPWQPGLRILRDGGEGPPDLMLLQGEGSSPAQLRPFARGLGFPAEGRLLLPEAPHLIAPDRRIWWDLDLTSYRRPGDAGVDLTSIDPRGMENAATLVRRALDHQGDSSTRPFVLGGFSQGAMVACEVAFNSDVPLSALVLLSGTYVDSTGWGWKSANRRGLPVFIAHGRQDPVFPFAQAERLAEHLARGQGEDHRGVEVTFVPFDGGHEITAEVQRALGIFLARLRAAAWRKQLELAAAPIGPTALSVKDLRGFLDGVPACDADVGSGPTPLEPSLELIGKRVTFTGTLSLENVRRCTMRGCGIRGTGRCCNTCGIRFQLTELGKAGVVIPLARGVAVNECAPSPPVELRVHATGVLVLDVVFQGPEESPSFVLQQANLCRVPGPWR